ncbi:MAG: membrane protein insertion efficiency factor YidD [Clostridia bacterium]|nr:membrane protein insertion efficiency factor YidD [Clostridia bacterium]
MKRLLILAVRFYQKYLSPLKKQPTCRFTPTCSAYAIQALQKRGAIVGTILTVMRILRCQPFGPCGWDPVPETGLRNRRSVGKPITKYFYPEEYHLERREEEGEDLPDQTQQ